MEGLKGVTAGFDLSWMQVGSCAEGVERQTCPSEQWGKVTRTAILWIFKHET